MISKINLAFFKCNKENRPALLTYTVAGDNTKKKITGNSKCNCSLCGYS